MQKRLGHASPESTRIYTRVSDPAVVADYNRALGGQAADDGEQAVRAGPISAAALAATSVTPAGRPRRRHCPEAEYLAFVARPGHPPRLPQPEDPLLPTCSGPRGRRWPTGSPPRWSSESVGCPARRRRRRPTRSRSNARPYLVFLGLRGYLTFDYAWMFGAGQIRVDDAATALGIDLGTGELIEEAVALGYNRNSARQAMRWTVGRIALHTGIRHASEITDDHITEALEAVRLFSERDDLHLLLSLGAELPRQRRPSSGSLTCTSCRWCCSTAARSPPSRAS